MKDNIGCIVYIIVVVVAIVLCVLYTKWIWESNLPMWAKWFFLK